MKKLLLSVLLLSSSVPSIAQTDAPALTNTAARAATVPATLSIGELQLALSADAQRLVQKRVDALLTQPGFAAQATQAEASFPIMARILEKAQVPVEFRYLALQLSGLRGDAPATKDGAAGYWQLRPDQAGSLGLRVDGLVDERRHLVASTRAAARAMLRHQAITRNWVNSLLCYRLGMDAVRPFLLVSDEGAKEMAITTQTHPYVLSFLAHRIAFMAAGEQAPAAAPYLREFLAEPGQTLAAQASIIATDTAVLLAHNPWLRANEAIPTDGGRYTLVVLVSKPEQLTAMAKIEEARRPAPPPSPNTGQAVVVNGLNAMLALPGERKEQFAERAQISLNKLLEYNELSAFDALVPGLPYFIQKKKRKAGEENYVARRGETMAIVSQKFGLKRQSLLAMNRMAETDELRPGRVLWLQRTRPANVEVEYRNAEPAPEPMLATAWALRPNDPTALAASEKARRYVGPEVFKGRVARERRVVTEGGTPDGPWREREEDDKAGRRGGLLAGPSPTSTPTRAAASAPAFLPGTQPAAQPAAAPKAPASTAATIRKAAPVAQPRTHRVAPGETLYAVARRYGVRPADLLAWNKLAPNAQLRVAQVLRVSPPTAAPHGKLALTSHPGLSTPTLARR